MILKSLVLSLSVAIMSVSAFASPADEVVGHWQMTKQSCSAGGGPALAVDGMHLDLDGKIIQTQIQTSGCSIEIKTPYQVAGQTIQFQIEKVSQVCPSGTDVYEIDPEPSEFPFEVNGNQLKVRAQISFLDGVCPSNGTLLVEFERK